jgi:hypothetical protein
MRIGGESIFKLKIEHIWTIKLKTQNIFGQYN